MRFIHAACLAFVVTSFVGCASAPSLQGARPTLSKNQKNGLARSGIVARTDHMTKLLDEDKSIVYFQNLGGGGAGVGVLLGPLGVAANMSMIDEVTTADVEKIKGRINLDPVAAFKEAALSVNYPVQDSASQGDVKVTPYLLISKTSESTLHVSSILLFEGMDGETKWLRRYQYQLSDKYTLEELSAFSATESSRVQAASAKAYAALLNYIAEETDPKIAKEQKITYKSAYLSPRFEFEMRGSLIGEKEGRTWIRTVTGVAAVDPANIRYQIVKCETDHIMAVKWKHKVAENHRK